MLTEMFSFVFVQKMMMDEQPAGAIEDLSFESFQTSLYVPRFTSAADIVVCGLQIRQEMKLGKSTQR